jgi:hypothetical protein
MNKVLTVALFSFLIMGANHSAYADAVGDYHGDGSAKHKIDCENEAKNKAADAAFSACRRDCNPKSIGYYEIDHANATASCQKQGKMWKGTGKVSLVKCECAAFVSEDPVTIVDQEIPLKIDQL